MDHEAVAGVRPSSQALTAQREASAEDASLGTTSAVDPETLQLQFQDSNLSPALPLLQLYTTKHNLMEFSLFQQSDLEFAPLRPYPDTSVASEQSDLPPHDHTTQSSVCASLSQHPLAQTTLASEISDSSCSQFSFQDDSSSTNKQKVAPSRGSLCGRESDTKRATDKPKQAPEDDTYFLSKHVPAQHLLDLLQEDVGVPSSSSSAVSSQKSSSAAWRETGTFKTTVDQSSTTTREGPSGEAFISQERTRTSFPDVWNVSLGSRSTQPDDSTETLHRELRAETTKLSGREVHGNLQLQKSGDKLTPQPAAVSDKSASTGHPRVLPWTGSTLTGVERLQRGHGLWSPATQTGIDGSYLGFLPQSQSTPGVFKLPLKSAKPAVGKLSDIESNKDESSIKISPEPAVQTQEANQSEEETSSTRVSALPTLDYKQKVDAWREYQTSGEPSLLDSLAMKSFLGTKTRVCDAVPDVQRQLQPPGVRRSSAAHSGSSSPRRTDAADGLALRDITFSSAQPSASPFGRSQSHSSLSTVVMSTQTEQQPGERPELDTQTVHQETNTTVEPSPRYTLDRFSDVSLDRDLTLSPSPDSYNNDDVKLATSVGASSVVSLEVDNYAPYWTSKPSTPAPQPRAHELNIEERIPLYLHNLGIDQSPSAILTPFAPRGPIREPEFSPTELSTIKGSTPTTSAQPSEGGSPFKGEYSRTSVWSADSSISAPFSLDSLGPAAPEHHRVSWSNRRLAACFTEVEPQMSAGQTSSQDRPELSFADSSDADVTLVDLQKSQEVPLLKISKGPMDSSLTFSAARPSSAHTWTRSGSSEVRRQSSIGQESASSSVQQNSPANTDVTPQRDTVVQGELSSLNISESTRRAEPEGCSAAPPDLPPPVAAPPPVVAAPVSTSSTSEDTQAVPQEEKTHEDPQENGSSSAVQVGSDRAVTSDESSESSLTVKVVKLLQMETPSTVTTSSPSTTDLEDSRVRDWIKLRKPGQLSRLPELDQEDREQVEEMKRELLLKNPTMTETSTDTESRSSGGAVSEQDGPAAAERVSRSPNPAPPACPNLEAQVREIAAREGVPLRRTRAEVHTSITMTTLPTPSPPQSSTPELLLLAELRTATLGHTLAEEARTSSQRSSSSERRSGRDEVRGQPDTSSMGSEDVDEPDGSFATGHQPQPPVSSAQVELAPKLPDQNLAVTAPSNPGSVRPAPARQDFVPLRPVTPSVISPDEGVGLTSPPEWNEIRSAAVRPPAPSFRSPVGPHRSSETPAPPVLLPYKPQGSDELFFMPQAEADISSTSMESSHTGSNDAIPPHFSSEVLGHQDPGLDRGVTLRHAEGIYSRRPNTATMQAAALRERSSQTRDTAAPQWSTQMSTQRSHVHFQASRTTKDQGTSPIQLLSSHPAGKSQTVAPDAVKSLGYQHQSANLDQLWSRFCEQWTTAESHPIRDSEVSLLERMERLSRLIQDDRSWTRPRQSERGRQEEDRGAREDSRLSSSFSSSNGLNLCPADRDESSTSMSTVDTARLLRAFGAHRVQQTRSSSSLSRLYSNISRQQEVLDSSSSSSFLDLSHQRPPRTVAAKRPVRMVSRGVQAGHLEIVSNATRRHTRDVGTTFPSPSENTAPPQADSSSCAERPEPRTSSILKRRSRRSPSGPRGVTWFISAEELRSDERKENQQESWRSSTSWFIRGSRTLREPLRQVHQNQEVEPHRPPRTYSGPEPVSLQESLQTRRPLFIVQSRERMVRLALQAEQRKLLDTMSRERDLLLHRTYEGRGPGRTHRPADVPVTRRAVSRKEMIQRSKQIYESLPEVQRKKDEERRRATYRSYRLNAQIYNKRITSRVLGRRRSAWK